MISFLTYPLALFAMATLPALAAIYLLRNRFRRRMVSSLLLWSFYVPLKAGGAKIHRLRLPPLFFLELLALALLVLAAAGPHWKLPQSSRPLVVVLDDSFSMRAVGRGDSARARAKTALEKLFRLQPPPSTRLILAGMRASSLGSPVKNWAQVDELLRQWHCWSPDAALDSAVTLAADLGRRQANILILTDQKPSSDQFSRGRIEWRAFGEPLGNIAIVNASRTAFGDQDRCLLETASYSGEARTARLLVQTGSNAPQSSLLAFEPRERKRLVFNLPANAPVLRASLEADALDADNEVQLLPPPRRRVRVRVALTNENMRSLAVRALDATGLRAAISADPEIVIHDTGADVGGNAWSLRWTGAGGTNAFVGPFVVDHSHPMAGDLALDGVVWAGADATNPPGDAPVILAGNTPLLAAREDLTGRRLLTLNFNPALSTMQDTPDWPILFWNLLHWRAGETAGLKESNARLGMEVVLKTTGEAVLVALPDGTSKSFRKTGGELALETPMPGLYTVMAGATTNQFSVNPLAPGESDLSACVTGRWGSWEETPGGRLEESSVAWLFGLLALASLAGHQMLVGKGNGGGR